jgi:hypothetical protein
MLPHHWSKVDVQRRTRGNEAPSERKVGQEDEETQAHQAPERGVTFLSAKGINGSSFPSLMNYAKDSSTTKIS